MGQGKCLSWRHGWAMGRMRQPRRGHGPIQQVVFRHWETVVVRNRVYCEVGVVCNAMTREEGCIAAARRSRLRRGGKRHLVPMGVVLALVGNHAEQLLGQQSLAYLLVEVCPSLQVTSGECWSCGGPLFFWLAGSGSLFVLK